MCKRQPAPVMPVQRAIAYNWGLARKIEAYQAGQKVPTAIDLHRELNALKKTELAWMYEVSKCAPQEALRNLDQAYAHFFRRVKEKQAGKKVKVGFPHFKSKKNGLGSFRLTGAIHVFEKAIQLPRLGRAAAEGARLSPDRGCPHPERHGERTRRALVCLGAGGDGNP